MYGRARKSWVGLTGPISCTTAGIGVAGCPAVVEAALAPPGEEVRLEANNTAEIEIRPKARVICNAEARRELSCFFFIFFLWWGSGTPKCGASLFFFRIELREAKGRMAQRSSACLRASPRIQPFSFA